MMVIAVSWMAPLAAQTEELYSGPQNIKFEASGVMVPTLSGSVDLVAGTADVTGPCPVRTRCSPSDERHISLSSPDLAKLRSLASEVSAKGLFDADCIEHQKKEEELANLRQKKEIEEKQAAWKKEHPGSKEPVPTFVPVRMPPLDPFFDSVTIADVGTVAITAGNYKSVSQCTTSATQAIWNMVMAL
jgi:hypothetical protein